MAIRTLRGRWWRWRNKERSFPVEEGEDALAAFGGGGSQPTEVADALKARRQDVLEEAMEKAWAAESAKFPLG